jgi:autotransporter-associated beta strand protein
MGGNGGNGGSGSGGGGGGAGGYGAVVTGSGASSNSGTITGGKGGGGGMGQSASSGSPDGTAGGGGVGVQFTASGATFTNSGSITGGNGGGPDGCSSCAWSFGRGGFGIVGRGVSVINSGTISGGLTNGSQEAAIVFTGGVNSLTLLPGSSINGGVNAAGAADSLILGGSGTATIDLSNYNSFGIFRKTGDGVWQLTGANNAGASWQIEGGILRVGSNAVLGAPAGVLTLDGGTLQLAADFDLARSIDLRGNGTIDTNGFSSTVTGAVTGAGGFIKTGPGMLTLAGANTYAGPTQVKGGTLAVTGSLGSDVTVAPAGTLAGNGVITGNVVNNGSLAPGNPGPAGPYGTLTIFGSYTQTAGSTYQVKVSASGQSDSLSVFGTTGTATATLQGGTVGVVVAPGPFAHPRTYTIVTAVDGVAGKFANVTTNAAALTATLSYDADHALLTVSAANFERAAQTPSEDAVAKTLNSADDTASGDFATVIGALTVLGGAQESQALRQIAGQQYAGFFSAGVQSAQLFMTNFAQQAGGGSSGGRRIALAEACDTACDATPSRWSAWGGGLAGFGTVVGDLANPGITYNMGGFAAGLDYRTLDWLRIGISAGYSGATLYTQGLPGIGTSDSLQVGLYTILNLGDGYLDGLAGYSRGTNRMTRTIAISGLDLRTARGETAFNQVFGHLETGYRIDLAGPASAFLSPFARMQGSSTSQDGFTESGANSLDLVVAAQTTNSLRSVLGAQLGGTIEAGLGVLDLTFRLGWSHEYLDLSRPVTAAFAGAPALGFTTQGAAAPRDGTVLGLAAMMALADRTSAYVRYDGEIAGNNSGHLLSAGVRFVW